MGGLDKLCEFCKLPDAYLPIFYHISQTVLIPIWNNLMMDYMPGKAYRYRVLE